VAGAAVRWLRDNLQIIKDSQEVESLANSVDGTRGVYFVPALSGLLAPHWTPDARGIILGLSQFSTKAHVARACLEAVCFQTRELLEAMEKDSKLPLAHLLVDGGMTKNTLMMETQADLLGIPVERPQFIETTALGAAVAAGMAPGVEVWKVDPAKKAKSDVFAPKISKEERNLRFARWNEAVCRSKAWAGDDFKLNTAPSLKSSINSPLSQSSSSVNSPLYICLIGATFGALAAVGIKTYIDSK
jgi:glycerol kinase